MTCAAEVLADSIHPVTYSRLTTMKIRYPRFAHAEYMTHRMFCLAGDAELEFDLPAGGTKTEHRVHKVRLDVFVDKWLNGARRIGSKPKIARLASMKIRQLNEETGDIQWATVKDARVSGLKKVFEVRAGKFKVAGSVDHRVMTNEGWKRIGDLKVGELLVVQRRGKHDDEKTDPLRLKKLDGVWRSSWQQKQAARMANDDPNCRSCKLVPGREVHHIVPVYQDPALTFVESNITWLCSSCHDAAHVVQDWAHGGTYLYGATTPIDEIVFRGEEQTYDLEISGTFPNFLANGVVVHNSRNASSTRAIPSKRQRQMIREDPALPVTWGENKPGMQQGADLPWWKSKLASLLSLMCMHVALFFSAALDRLGVHKALAGRLIEPWAHITVICTGTDSAYANFYALRRHEMAEPTIHLLADKMAEAHRASRPRLLEMGEWHLPLITDDERAPRPVPPDGFTLARRSVARCARVSYNKPDGKPAALAEDIALFQRLVGAAPMHASPAEHQAYAVVPRIVDGRGGCFGSDAGWVQFRKTLRGEVVTDLAKVID